MHRSVLFALLAFAFACSSPIITKEKVQDLNKEFEKVTYVALADLKPEFSDGSDAKTEVLFKKGETLRLVAENGEDWVRIKAYPAAAKREQAVGKTILYLLKDDVTGEPVEAIHSRLAKLVSVKR